MNPESRSLILRSGINAPKVPIKDSLISTSDWNFDAVFDNRSLSKSEAWSCAQIVNKVPIRDSLISKIEWNSDAVLIDRSKSFEAWSWIWEDEAESGVVLFSSFSSSLSAGQLGSASSPPIELFLEFFRDVTFLSDVNVFLGDVMTNRGQSYKIFVSRYLAMHNKHHPDCSNY